MCEFESGGEPGKGFGWIIFGIIVAIARGELIWIVIFTALPIIWYGIKNLISLINDFILYKKSIK